MKTIASRRAFIQSICGGAVASQLVNLFPHAAFAQGAAPKRILFVFHPMGYLESLFWPKGEGAGFTLGESQQPLTPFKDKLLYVDGLMHSHRAYWERERWDRWGADNEHGSGINGMFTGSWIDKSHGYAASASLDQVLAEAISKEAQTPYKSIALGAYTSGGPHGSAFFVGAGNPVKPVTSARQAYDAFFANLPTGGTMPGAMLDNSAALKLLKQRQRIIDSTRAEFKAVCAKIGAEEKAMCDAHVAAIGQLENRLKKMSSPVSTIGCTKPGVPAGSSDPQVEIRSRMDLVKAAFSCDLTRVMTLQIGGADGGVDVSGLPGHHDTTHQVGDNPSPTTTANHKRWDTWWASQWAYLLEQLNSVNEGDGTLLDNTLIVFGSDTTSGESMQPGAHQSYRFPMWTAGGSNFAFRTGRVVKLPYTVSDDFGRHGAQWTYHNAMLVSVARAMGLSIDKFGTWDQGKGPVPGLV